MGQQYAYPFLKGKVHFWPSNYCPSLVLAIELQNRVSLTTQLSKPFIFSHRTVLVSGFADVDATWRWGPPVSLTLSFFSPLPLSPFSYRSPLTLRRRPPSSPSAPLRLTRPAALARGGAPVRPAAALARVAPAPPCAVMRAGRSAPATPSERPARRPRSSSSPPSPSPTPRRVVHRWPNRAPAPPS